jgi:hypothetical protein
MHGSVLRKEEWEVEIVVDIFEYKWLPLAL